MSDLPPRVADRDLTDAEHAEEKRLDRTKYLRATPSHPSDITRDLGLAIGHMLRLIEAAERRGDPAGADAWRIALEAIEHASREVDKRRTQQRWRP